MKQIEIIDRTRAYFDAFSNKDTGALYEMFDNSVSLRDWNVSASGIESVVKVNREIFDSCNQLSVTIEKIHTSEMTAVAEIKINIDDNEILVADFINFNSGGLITSVVAYRGN